MSGKIVLTGASGFIGRCLVDFLTGKQYDVVVLTRDPEKQKAGKPYRNESQVQFAQWDGQTLTGWEKHLEGAFAVVNLAGENIASGKWTTAKKEKILNSRVLAGKILTKALERTVQKPRVLVQASAIGFYGSRGEEIIDETTLPGQGFLSHVVKEWEAGTQNVTQYGIRRVVVRMAMVLDTTGGSFPRLLKPFRFFVGGPIGSGKQWMSWIHIDDVTGAMLFLMNRDDLTGVFNLVSPHPVRNKEFARTLGKILKRPWFLPVPAFVLKALFGEMAQEVMLSSQRTVPKRLLDAGFPFHYPQLKEALGDLLNIRNRAS